MFYLVKFNAAAMKFLMKHFPSVCFTYKTTQSFSFNKLWKDFNTRFKYENTLEHALSSAKIQKQKRQELLKLNYPQIITEYLQLGR